MKIDSIDMLLELNNTRIKCPKCDSSESIYCPFCLIPLGHVPPTVELPIKVDIYRHPHEKAERTTTAHCKLVSPLNVNIIVDKIDHDISSRYTDPSRVLILYPSKTSIPLSMVPKGSFDTLIVIDGTWNHTKGMIARCSNSGFTHVRIEEHETKFWRFQNMNRTFLATVEAIYWFFVEYHKVYELTDYDGRFDNILICTC